MATLGRIHAPVFALAFGLLAVSPAAADEPAATVTGHVTFNGQPLGEGMVIFHLDDDEFVGSKVKDGRFKVTRVPAGEWRVAFRGRPNRSRSDELPAKYASEDNSGISVVVKRGKNMMAFDLKD